VATETLRTASARQGLHFLLDEVLIEHAADQEAAPRPRGGMDHAAARQPYPLGQRQLQDQCRPRLPVTVEDQADAGLRDIAHGSESLGHTDSYKSLGCTDNGHCITAPKHSA
jgi:hypothetical protein